MLWTIYRHINKITNNSYVGRTSKINPNHRWNNGKGYAHCVKFNAAIQKYGWDNFIHEILEHVDTEEKAIERETFYKIKFDTINNGYNIILDESKAPMLGRKQSDYQKQMISESNKNRHWTDESKQKVSKNHANVRGENGPSAKLTNIIVIEIRTKYSTNNYTQRELSKEYNVSQANISDIINYNTWQDI